MKKFIISCLGLFCSLILFAQNDLKYQKPSKEILELVDVERAPSVRIDSKGENMILLYRDAYKSIQDLSEKEMRLAGLRINPVTNIGSRTSFYNNIRFKKVKADKTYDISGLPDDPRISNISWSPDQSMIAFTHTSTTEASLWVISLKTKAARKLSESALNANMRNCFYWSMDNSYLLVKVLPKTRADLIDKDRVVPTGPTISNSTGEKAQNRTYQDLLKDTDDEFNFEQLVLSEIYKVYLDGREEIWAEAKMHLGLSFSPDGQYILLSEMHKPFSYLVTYSRFPSTTSVYTHKGELVKVIHEKPLIEELPKGFMATQTGRRSISWRSDKPSTLVWAEALDGGDPAVEAEYRDAVFQWSTPFEGEPTQFAKTKQRFAGVQWTNSDFALLNDYWWNTRNTKTYLIKPDDNTFNPEIIIDRNYQDRYNDPGRPITVKNKLNRSVISVRNNTIQLVGAGFSPSGQFPFIDEMNLLTKEKNRIYQSDYTDRIENIYSAIDIEKACYLVSIQSPTDYPNYYIRDLGKKADQLTQVTNNENPFSSLGEVHKEVLKYKRGDGLDLSGTLYLPKGYDKNSGNKVPLLIWAYPREYKDKASAGQVTQNKNSFIYPNYGSFVYWITKGYAVLDNAAFPIVGEGDSEPNDDFRKQLVANAKAAIDAVDSLGYIDRNRVACGGHSYGAFMVANLLSHSDLFAAGIARSGAYNRTLTPFGFQSEERSYWDAPAVYNTMSPFMHADKMKYPLLLIHGEADNNSGTYPMQSERYFNALKGLGATSRLVVLPKESHGYRAKESILHMLWEQEQWLDKYVMKKAAE